MPKRGQNQHTTVTIVKASRMDHDMQQRTYRVDQDMSLLAFDFLACVIPMRVDVRAPFSALLMLWLSMTAAVGLACLPADLRPAT
jgi:hypothetical protein